MELAGIRVLTTAQAAAALGVPPRRLAKWRMRNDGPPFVRLGLKTVRYRPAALAAWIAAQEQPQEAAK